MIHNHDFDTEEADFTPRQRLLIQLIAWAVVLGLTIIGRRLLGIE